MDINNKFENVNKDLLYRQNKYSSGKLELDRKFVRKRLLINLLQFFVFLFIIGGTLLIINHFKNPSIRYHGYNYNVKVDLIDIQTGDTVFFNPYKEISFTDKIIARFTDKDIYVGKIKLLPQAINIKTGKQVASNTYVIESLNPEETRELEINKNNILGFTQETIKTDTENNKSINNQNPN